MKSDQISASLHQQRLQNELAHLESQRREVALQVILSLLPYCVVVTLVGGFIVYKWAQVSLGEFYTSEGDYKLLFAGILGFLFIMSPIIYHFLVRRKRAYQRYLYDSTYFRNYKREVLSKVLEQLDEKLSYSADIGIPEAVFRSSGFPLFSNLASYYSSDSIFAEIGSTNAHFGEVYACQYIDEHKLHQLSDLFRGVFFTADFHKKVKFNTIIYPARFRYFSKFLVGKFSEEEHFKLENYQRIKLEDMEFERLFSVYGSDQLESRYILSPALMARLVDFRRSTKRSISISFKNSKVFIAIHYPSSKSLFKPPLFRSVNNLKGLRSYVSCIQLMIDITKELNLNSKIKLQ